MSDPRTRELKDNLAAVDARITRAVERAGRSDSPQLVVVTKFFPASDVLRLLELGVRDFGENRDQEASAKAAEVSRLLAGHHLEVEPRWHFVGQLQSKKARSVVKYARTVHSVDRRSLVQALRRATTPAESDDTTSAHVGPVDCLIQVDLRSEVPEDARGGAAPGAVAGLADEVASAQGLRLAGLMAVAPRDEPAAQGFARLAELSHRLRADHPAADMISAGMSNDVEEAVAAGATHLRIGRDVLGNRSPAR